MIYPLLSKMESSVEILIFTFCFATTGPAIKMHTARTARNDDDFSFYEFKVVHDWNIYGLKSRKFE